MNIEGCPCCSGKPYTKCCEPAHMGKEPSHSCEALMRSRYAAYVMHLTNYLISTTHPNSQTKGLERNIESSYRTVRWLGLTIKHVQNGGDEDKVGKVEFIARFDEEGKEGALHEFTLQK